MDNTGALEEWKDAWHTFRSAIANKPEEATRLTGLVDKIYDKLKLRKECDTVKQLIDYFMQDGHKALQDAFPGMAKSFYFDDYVLTLERIAYYKRYLEIRPQGDIDGNKIHYHRK